MKMFITSTLVLLAGAMTYSNLHNHKDCLGFLPQNNLQIPVMANFTQGSGLTESQFNEIIDRVESVYTELVAETGHTLNIRRHWSSGDVNASARQIARTKTWEVNMYGGLARHQNMGEESFTTVLCHELGHHFGGAPKKTFMSWASNEGQSDYYAATKCIRKLYTPEENESYVSDVELNEYARNACDIVFESDINELASCYRSARAGEDIALMFQDLTGLSETPTFDTPDTRVVRSTDHNHPAPQCRLDTYFNGALCNSDSEIDFDDSDASIGGCNRTDEVAILDNEELPKNAGTRPLCWYKPENTSNLIAFQ